MKPGDSVVVSTADGHRFHGILVECRWDRLNREHAVIRLDTGWVTSYPMDMVRAESQLHRTQEGRFSD